LFFLLDDNSWFFDNFGCLCFYFGLGHTLHRFFDFDLLILAFLFFLSIAKSWWRVTCIAFHLIWDNNNFFSFLSFHVGGLNWVIPTLFAFSFIEPANWIDLSNHILVNCNSFFRIMLLILKHRDIKHFVLYFFLADCVPLHWAETASSQLGFSLNFS